MLSRRSMSLGVVLMVNTGNGQSIVDERGGSNFGSHRQQVLGHGNHHRSCASACAVCSSLIRPVFKGLAFGRGQHMGTKVVE